MNAPQHTFGPWEVVDATEHHGPYVVTQFGSTVCDLYTMTRPDLPSTANGGPSKPVPFLAEEATPNARLIAASPELLGALEAIEDALANPVRPGHVAYKSKADLIAIATRALAKARGEQA